MLFTETSQTPWMSIAAAATAAPQLEFTTGIAVAFPRSPMIAAGMAWELAENTGGRFRLGLGSQVRAHIERRYGAAFDPPGPRMRDYVLAVKACLRAFRGEEPLAHDGPYYKLSLLPATWAPPPHDYGDIKVDVSAVGTVDVPHGRRGRGRRPRAPVPLAALPAATACCPPSPRARPRRADRSSDVDLIVPVFAVPGDTPGGARPARSSGRGRRSPSTARPGTTRSSSTTSASRGRPPG